MVIWLTFLVGLWLGASMVRAKGKLNGATELLAGLFVIATGLTAGYIMYLGLGTL